MRLKKAFNSGFLPSSVLLETIPQLTSLSKKPSSRFAIKTNGRIVFINPADVVAIEAEGNYVLLQQRSVVINSSYVAEIEPCLTGDYALRIRGGKEYTVTRTYKKGLRSLAEFWIGTDSFLTD